MKEEFEFMCECVYNITFIQHSLSSKIDETTIVHNPCPYIYMDKNTKIKH